MATREEDLISEAMDYTNQEVWDSAWKGNDSDSGPLDESGDRSPEEMGEGLEGQHEPQDEEAESEDEEAEDSEGEEAEDSEGEEEGEEQAEQEEGEEEGDDEAPEAEPEAAKAPEPEAKPEGRVPSGRLREQTERAERAERELQALRDSSRKDIDELRGQMSGLMTALQQGRQQPQPAPQPQPVQPQALPDVFENPQAFGQYFVDAREQDRQQFGQLLNQMRVENSLAIAHAIHKEDFAKAFEAANKLPPNTPETRDTVTRIFTSPNPGEALVQWHKRVERDQKLGNESLDDHDKRVRQEEREAMKNDPEYRRELLASLRAEAAGETGKPARTMTRLPKSLNGAAGSSSNKNRNDDPTLYDDSDRSVFESAWR